MRVLESLLDDYVRNHPGEASVPFEEMDTEEAVRAVQSLSVRSVGLLLERLTPHRAARILSLLPGDRARELVQGMPPRPAALLIQHLEEGEREALLAPLPASVVHSLRELASYPAETAGGMMEPRVVSIPMELTVQAAISLLRRTRGQALFYLYVTDREGKLAGVLNMRDLLLASPKDRVETLVRRDILSVPANTPREEVVGLVRRHRFLALPVVDGEGRLIGVIRHDEALRATQQEAFEDLQRMVGAGGDERALSPVGTVVRRRLPWLYVNLGTAFLAASVVGLFEGVIQQVSALAVLLPIVSGQGGNAGCQSLAVVMRGIALKEILPGRGKRVVLKELLAGILNGMAVAVVTALAVGLWSGKVGLALVIGLSMIVNMGMAGLAGAVIPMVLKALKRDPAQSSAIFLTTVTDVVGFASFLGCAVLFLPWLV